MSAAKRHICSHNWTDSRTHNKAHCGGQKVQESYYAQQDTAVNSEGTRPRSGERP